MEMRVINMINVKIPSERSSGNLSISVSAFVYLCLCLSLSLCQYQSQCQCHSVVSQVREYPTVLRHYGVGRVIPTVCTGV